MDISSRRKTRENIINYIYYFELFNVPIDDKNAFEQGDFNSSELKIIKSIMTNQVKLVALIKKFLSPKWPWTRVPPLIRAIIIYGSFELSVNEKAVVINELVDITKIYTIEEDYKFVNGILDNIGDYYEKIKSNQKTTEKK